MENMNRLSANDFRAGYRVDPKSLFVIYGEDVEVLRERLAKAERAVWILEEIVNMGTRDELRNQG